MATNWKNLQTVKKGDIGEKLVNEYLIDKSFIPYSPDADGAHPFDRLVASRDKKTIFIADAKTKAKRKFYPDTGIDIRHYNEYKYIQDKYNIDVFIFFVDEEAKKIYGNFLRALEKRAKIVDKNRELEYPLFQKGIIYFPMIYTKHIANIPEDEAVILQTLTTKKEDYKRSSYDSDILAR